MIKAEIGTWSKVDDTFYVLAEDEQGYQIQAWRLGIPDGPIPAWRKQEIITHLESIEIRSNRITAPTVDRIWVNDLTKR